LCGVAHGYTVILGKKFIQVASGSIAAGDNKLDYTSDNAFIEFGVDISAYHGNHKIVVTDSAGKSASGYLHSIAPGGVTLGGDVMSGWDFTSGFSILGPASIIDANSFSGIGGVLKNYLTEKQLYKISNSGASTATCDVRVCTQAGTVLKIFSLNDFSYVTAIPLYIYIQVRNSTDGTTDVTTLKAEPVTDCPATGALIVSTLGGSTRSWTSVDTGFNPNLACEWKIFRV